MTDAVKPVQEKAVQQNDSGAATHSASQGLVNQYLDLMRQVPGRLGKDEGGNSAASAIDTTTEGIYKGLFNANGSINGDQAKKLIANLKDDQAGDTQYGGSVVSLPDVSAPNQPRKSTILLDGQGDDGKNAKADQDAIDAANKVLDPKNGVKLTEAQRKAIEGSITTLNQDKINSQQDNELEPRYYRNDQAVIDDLTQGASPEQVRQDMTRVLADRAQDKVNEATFNPADQAAVTAAQKVISTFAPPKAQHRQAHDRH